MFLTYQKRKGGRGLICPSLRIRGKCQEFIEFNRDLKFSLNLNFMEMYSTPSNEGIIHLKKTILKIDQKYYNFEFVYY